MVRKSGQLHSESESEDFLQASTLTLVPESEDDYVSMVRDPRESSDSKPSNGHHEYENVLLKEQSCTKLEDQGKW